MQLARESAAEEKEENEEKKKQPQARHPSIRDRHVIYKQSHVTRRVEIVRRIHGTDVVSNS